ncbi:LacI family DNA-binding transcriptional regulator [Saccharicrinis sp. FJH54]|uniref:LacI family DNA-binding transcriptional regulator n=1 Tax=Saccharicrinis sp. FJH54 TaxID=3344665 RepID=UPI0035D4F2BC
MTAKKTTIHDIARELGITASTVSRALNNHPSISKETKKTVLAKAREMNYLANSLASYLRTGKSNTIGLIVPRINRFFFADIIAGIESITNPAGYNLIICQSDESFKKEVENINTLFANRVDGVLLSVSKETTTTDHLKLLTENNLPLVLIDRIIEGIDVSRVTNDNFQGTYDATRHLIQQGFKNIAHFGGDFSLYIYKRRLEGYIKAMQDYHLPVREEWIAEHMVSREEAFDFTAKLHNLKQLPDAFVCASDYAAHGVLLYLIQHGIQVPRDAGITGFANEPFTQYVQPSLSSIHQFGNEMGKKAANVLLNEIEAKSEDSLNPQTIYIKPELLIRDSSNRNI